MDELLLLLLLFNLGLGFVDLVWKVLIFRDIDKLVVYSLGFCVFGSLANAEAVIVFLFANAVVEGGFLGMGGHFFLEFCLLDVGDAIVLNVLLEIAVDIFELEEELLDLA